ncbi:MAG: ribbon-helix-helix domain-containing protein [Pseudomonadota bacterium]
MPNDEENNELADILNQPVIKHSVNIAGHATSVSIEKPFWDIFTNLTKQNGKSINQLITEIDEARSINLSSAIRLYVLNSLK